MQDAITGPDQRTCTATWYCVEAMRLEITTLPAVGVEVALIMLRSSTAAPTKISYSTLEAPPKSTGAETMSSTSPAIVHPTSRPGIEGEVMLGSVDTSCSTRRQHKALAKNMIVKHVRLGMRTFRCQLCLQQPLPQQKWILPPAGFPCALTTPFQSTVCQTCP